MHRTKKDKVVVFLSHRIDFLSVERAQSIARQYRILLADASIEIVSMSDDLTQERETGATDQEIVEKCLSSLRKCDLLIFDCSLEHWNYVGCIFEVVYAHQQQKPIFIYTGNSSIIHRPWLRHHSTFITNSKEELRVETIRVCNEMIVC